MRPCQTCLGHGEVEQGGNGPDSVIVACPDCYGPELCNHGVKVYGETACEDCAEDQARRGIAFRDCLPLHSGGRGV